MATKHSCYGLTLINISEFTKNISLSATGEFRVVNHCCHYHVNMIQQRRPASSSDQLAPTHNNQASSVLSADTVCDPACRSTSFLAHISGVMNRRTDRQGRQQATSRYTARRPLRHAVLPDNYKSPIITKQSIFAREMCSTTLYRMAMAEHVGLGLTKSIHF